MVNRYLVVAWMLSLCSFLAPEGTHAETLTGRTVGVSDGDTITVLDITNTQHKVRLAGIDAPEKSQPFWQRSKESLSALVFGRTVTVETDKVDRYRRKVGKVRTPEGTDANLEQVRRGLAWHYKEYEQEQSEADRATYAAAENIARGQRQGLWVDAQPVALWEFRKTAR
jgi:endonuclease YncB( thermonuclease family)